MTNQHKPTLPFVIIILALILGACQSAPAPTATALPPTAEATQTPTPEPTATITPTSTATPDFAATAVQRITNTAAPIVANVEETLKKYEIDGSGGSLHWFSKEEHGIPVTEYNMIIYETIKEAGAVGDFVLKADILWNSTSGLAGCGLVYRSEDESDFSGKYFLQLIRIMNAPAWRIDFYDKATHQKALTNYMYDNIINDEQDSTNEVILIAKGGEYTVIINGKKMLPVKESSVLKGYIGFIAHQESGTTLCQFSDMWLWAWD